MPCVSLVSDVVCTKQTTTEVRDRVKPVACMPMISPVREPSNIRCDANALLDLQF